MEKARQWYFCKVLVHVEVSSHNRWGYEVVRDMFACIMHVQGNRDDNKSVVAFHGASNDAAATCDQVDSSHYPSTSATHRSAASSSTDSAINVCYDGPLELDESSHVRYGSSCLVRVCVFLYFD